MFFHDSTLAVASPSSQVDQHNHSLCKSQMFCFVSFPLGKQASNDIEAKDTEQKNQPTAPKNNTMTTAASAMKKSGDEGKRDESAAAVVVADDDKDSRDGILKEPLLVATTSNVLYEEEYKPWWASLLIIVFPILPLFWKYHVKLVEEENKQMSLSFGFSSSLTSKTITSQDVQHLSAKPVQINGLTQWGGYGIRLRLPSFKKGCTWDTGYIVKNGTGVEIITTVCKNKDKQQVHVFNCEEPEKVCQLLNHPSTDTGTDTDSNNDDDK